MKSSPAQFDFRVGSSQWCFFVCLFVFCFVFSTLLQIWTSPVSSQSIKPNYPHYKGPAVDTVNFILSRWDNAAFHWGKTSHMWLVSDPTHLFFFSFCCFPSPAFAFYSKLGLRGCNAPLQEIGDGWPRWAKIQNVYTISGNVDFLFSAVTRTAYCIARRKKLFYARRTKETIIKGFHFNSSGPIFCSRGGISKQKRLFAPHCSKKKHWHLLFAPLHLTTSLWSSLTMSPLQYLKPISAPKMKLSLKWSNHHHQFLWRLSFSFPSLSPNKVLPVCVLQREKKIDINGSRRLKTFNWSIGYNWFFFSKILKKSTRRT